MTPQLGAQALDVILEFGYAVIEHLRPCLESQQKVALAEDLVPEDVRVAAVYWIVRMAGHGFTLRSGGPPVAP